jgi:hypothetical protein
MYPKNVYEPACSVDRSALRQGLPPMGGSSQEATAQLTKRAAMTVILVLSFGLWAAIWAALASLASATLG